MKVSDKIIENNELSKTDENEINIIIEQIELKGVLTMQDFKHKLCELLPGMFSSLLTLLSKIHGSELDIMLKNGEIKSEILPELFKRYELVEFKKKSGLKNGYDFNELERIIKTVVSDPYDSLILWEKLMLFIGFEHELLNDNIHKHIAEYDNAITQAEFRKKVKQ